MPNDVSRILEQEAHVIRSCLCTGLTELRNANLNERGRYYSAFFQLAIGIERLAKLALILDHMSTNNLVAPGRAAVRDYGHDLRALIAKVQTTATTRGYALSSAFPDSTLCASVLAFLSDFATGMRYANLDALATGTHQRDPLSEWNSILQVAAEQRVRPVTRQRATKQAVGIAHALGGAVAVVASDLSGKPLTATTALLEPTLLDHASKHIVWELVALLCPLRDVVVAAGHAADTLAVSRRLMASRVPALSEFFEFLWADRDYVLRKKRWP